MKKLTDQELDSIFKSAAEGLEPSFDSAGWDAVNAKLDQPKPTIWKGWMPFVILGIIIFSTGVWVGIRFNQNRLQNQTQSIVKAESKELNENGKIATRKNPDQIRISTNQTPNDKETFNEKETQRIAVTKQLNKAVVDDDLVSKKDNPLLIKDNNDLRNDTKSILPIESNQLTVISIASENLTDSLPKKADVHAIKSDTTQSNSEETNDKEKPVVKHAIFLRALASPDFSSINYASTSETGSNYSLLVEYQVTNRWSISSGVIWSMKKYSSNKEVTYGKYTADRMVGDCRILDIPVNVYYHFRPLSRVSFYAGAGLSSYIMLEEDYTYSVDYSSGSRDFSYYIEKKNNEWFKMLNLSVGMQYHVAPRFQLQVEPFLKAPLTGVGEWDVRLSSFGVFLGVKYKIN